MTYELLNDFVNALDNSLSKLHKLKSNEVHTIVQIYNYIYIHCCLLRYIGIRVIRNRKITY